MEKKNYADVLESYTIAEEGIFAKFKERRERKKLARAEAAKRKEEALATFREFANTDLELLKKLVTNITNKAKSGYIDLPWKIEFNTTKGTDYICVDVSIFKDEWCLNEYSDQYDERADERFEFIFNEIDKQCRESGAFKNKIELELIENNIITISILADY